MDDDSYDPYKFREVEKPNNTFETCVHFLRATIGTGILVLPFSMKENGWFAGSIYLFVATLICLHVMHIIYRCEYRVCKMQRIGFISYKDCFKFAIDNGPSGLRKMSTCLSWSVDILIIAFQIGVLSVYIVFVTGGVLQIWNHFLPQYHLTLVIFICILFIFFALILFVPNLKVLSYFGLVANIAMLISLGAMFYYFCQDLPNLFEERNLAGEFKEIPFFLGTATFATMAIAAFLTLEEKIKNPRTFVRPFGVLNLCLLITFFIYLAFGVFGYWKYGDETKSNITLNVPITDPLGIAILATMAFAIYVSYGLQGFVTFNLLWFTYIQRSLEEKKISKGAICCFEYSIRLSLTLGATILAISLPFLDILVGFIGAVAMGAVGFIFPPLMELSLCHYEKHYGKLKWILIKDIILLIFGFGLMLTGITATVYSIFEKYT